MTVKLAKRLIEPDYWTCPHGYRTRPEPALTYGPEVADVCAAAGFGPDPQQELGLDLIFAIRPDGSPACFEFCVICSRQNLKTGLFLQAAIGWLFVLDVPEVVWSAHEMSTTRSAQNDLANIIREAPNLRKRMMTTKNEGIYDANGEERIELAPLPGRSQGQVIWYKARTRDGGRGLARPKLVLDEAFALKASMLGALIPILLAQVDPQVLYGSSPGKADSLALHALKERGRAGTSPRLSYLDWSAEGEAPPCEDADCTHPLTGFAEGDPCVLNRLELIVARNPALNTGRITLETLADIRQTLSGTPELNAEWLRECMAYWEEPLAGGPPFFGPHGWDSCKADPTKISEAAQHPAPGAIGIAVSLDRAWASIGGASRVDDGLVQVGAVDRRRGVRWVVDRAKEIQDKHKCRVAIDGKGPASNLVDALVDAGVDLTILGANDVCDASELTYDLVQEQGIRHFAYDELEDAVAGAGWREIGDRRAIGRRKSTSEVSMLEGVAFATWALLQAEENPPTPFFVI